MNVVAASADDFAWLVERTQCGVTDGFRAIKAERADGSIAGMVGYDSWTENAVSAHIALDTPVALKALLPAIFEYPFLECGKGVLLATIPESNRASWSLCLHLGFDVVARVPDGWDVGDGLVMLQMRAESCKYLRGRH